MKCRIIIAATLIGVFLIACQQTGTVRRTPTPRMLQPLTPTPFPSSTLTVTPRDVSAITVTATPDIAHTVTALAWPELTPTASATAIPEMTVRPAGPDVTIVRIDKVAEWVELRNVGDVPQSLDGWMLRSEKGSQDCPLSGSLAAGQTLRVWALAEDLGQRGYNCQFDANIWNNNESDPAVLFDAAGDEVARFEQ